MNNFHYYPLAFIIIYLIWAIVNQKAMLVDNLIPLITSTKARVPPSMEETIPIFHTEKTSSTTSIYHLRFLPVHPRKNVKYVELHVDSILNERYRIEPQN